MGTTSRTIELDADTAVIVERRSAEESVSVSEFIAALVARDDAHVGSADAAEVAELDRCWAAIQQGNQPSTTPTCAAG